VVVVREVIPESCGTFGAPDQLARRTNIQIHRDRDERRRPSFALEFLDLQVGRRNGKFP